MMNNKIFVSIAALEEPNLGKTIASALDSAEFPEEISFGISLQYDEAPDLSFIKNKVKTISYSPNIDLPTAPGIIEIRSNLRKLIDDEEYFLQVDSHTRFESGWDSKLISDLKDLMKIKEKTIISSQLWHEADKNRYTKIRVRRTYHYQFESDGLEIYGDLLVDEDSSVVNNRMVNESYFLNHYVSGNFYFCHRSYLKDMEFPDYHKFPFEESELSLVTFCNGYDVVAPTKENIRVFADNDEKYHNQDDPRWWKKIGDCSVRKWVYDSKEIFLEAVGLMMNGENRYMNINNLSRPIDEFYEKTDAKEEFDATKLWYNSL
jgi:hypothetical protein